MIKLKKGEDGKPLITQHIEGSMRLTWNPDDDRFYIDATEVDKDFPEEFRTLGSFNRHANATSFFRKKQKSRGKKK